MKGLNLLIWVKTADFGMKTVDFEKPRNPEKARASMWNERPSLPSKVTPIFSILKFKDVFYRMITV